MSYFIVSQRLRTINKQRIYKFYSTKFWNGIFIFEGRVYVLKNLTTSTRFLGIILIIMFEQKEMQMVSNIKEQTNQKKRVISELLFLIQNKNGFLAKFSSILDILSIFGVTFLHKMSNVSVNYLDKRISFNKSPMQRKPMWLHALNIGVNPTNWGVRISISSSFITMPMSITRTTKVTTKFK